MTTKSSRTPFPPKAKILVLGAVKDVANHLEENLAGLRRVLAAAEVKWHLVESNSSDGTLDALVKVSSSFAELTFEQLMPRAAASRLAEITRARMALLAHAKQVRPIPDFIFLVDLDQPYDWSTFSFKTCLESFDAIFCHQDPYYDIFALEMDRPRDQTSGNERTASGLLAKLRRYLVSNPQLQIRIGSAGNPLRVRSAFGGMALYRAEVFLWGDYMYQVNDPADLDQTCEHIRFHRKVGVKYSDLFIDPCFHAPVINGHSRIALAFRKLLG